MNIDQELLFPSLRSKKTLISIELLLLLIAILVWEITDLPKSIIPIFLFCCLSLRLRDMNWQSVGLKLKKPHHLLWTILLGIGFGVFIQLIGLIVIQPLLLRYLRIASIDPRNFSSISASIPLFFIVLIGQWILAGLGEETVFRGYLLNRFIDLAGKRTAGIFSSIVISSMLFSLLHGLLGMPFFILTFIIGYIYSAVYLAVGRNLWLTIITHGMANSIAFSLAFLR